MPVIPCEVLSSISSVLRNYPIRASQDPLCSESLLLPDRPLAQSRPTSLKGQSVCLAVFRPGRDKPLCLLMRSNLGLGFVDTAGRLPKQWMCQCRALINGLSFGHIGSKSF